MVEEEDGPKTEEAEVAGVEVPGVEGGVKDGLSSEGGGGCAGCVEVEAVDAASSASCSGWEVAGLCVRLFCCEGAEEELKDSWSWLSRSPLSPAGPSWGFVRGE